MVRGLSQVSRCQNTPHPATVLDRPCEHWTHTQTHTLMAHQNPTPCLVAGKGFDARREFPATAPTIACVATGARSFRSKGACVSPLDQRATRGHRNATQRAPDARATMKCCQTCCHTPHALPPQHQRPWPQLCVWSTSQQWQRCHVQHMLAPGQLPRAAGDTGTPCAQNPTSEPLLHPVSPARPLAMEHALWGAPTHPPGLRPHQLIHRAPAARPSRTPLVLDV